VTGLLGSIFQPGFFDPGEVRTALIIGGVVAVVSGVVGVFTVLRGQSFAGHSLADVGATGGSGAFLVGVPQLWGFLAFTLAGSGLMELIGIQRARGRDLATGIVLGGSLGVAALFLYEDTVVHSTTGAAQTILFGSIFAINTSTIPLVIAFSFLSVLLVVVLFRPLLLCGAHPDLAAARGIPVRAVSALFLADMAIAVALSAITIGSILSTALLIGPAATAVRLTRRPLLAMLWAAVIAVAATWLGVLLSYDSYTWPPSHHGWPVSFFVVALIFVAYLTVDLGGGWSRRRRARELSLERQRAGVPQSSAAAGLEVVS
jgi:zinc/manganese transport system permease protein